MGKLNTFPPTAARFFSKPKVRTRPIPVELTTEGSRDSLTCPSRAPLRAQASLPLSYQPCASRAPSTNCRDTADQGFAAVPCPRSLYGLEAESARQARPFFPSGASEALLCCAGTYLVAVITLFEVISSYLSYLPPFHRKIELLSVWGQRLHTLSELTAGNLKAFLGQAMSFQSPVWKRNQAVPPTASALESKYYLSANLKLDLMNKRISSLSPGC